MAAVVFTAPPGQLDVDFALPDGLEDGDGLSVAQTVRRMTVHAQDFVT